MTATNSVIAPNGRRIPNPNAVVGGLVDRRPVAVLGHFQLAVGLAHGRASFVRRNVHGADQSVGHLHEPAQDEARHQHDSGVGSSPRPIASCSNRSASRSRARLRDMPMCRSSLRTAGWSSRSTRKFSGKVSPATSGPVSAIFPGRSEPHGYGCNLVNGFPAPQAKDSSGGRIRKVHRALATVHAQLLFPGTPPTLAAAFKLVVFLDGLSDTVVQ